MSRSACALLLALLPLAGGAAAAGLAGNLAFPAGLALAGDVVVASPRGALDLAPGGVSASGVSVRFALAEGYVVTREWEYRGVPGVAEQFLGAKQPRNDSVSFPGGVLENLTCGRGCSILLFAADAGASLGLGGRAAGPLGVLPEARVYAAGARDRPAEDSFLYRAEQGWVAASARPVAGVPSLLLAGAEARAGGALGLFLENATGEWRSGGEVRPFTTETSSHPMEGPGGAQVGRRVQSRFMVLQLSGAELVAPAGAGVALLAPAPSLDVSGALRADEARGVLVVGDRRLDLAGESLEVEGALGARPAVAPLPVAALAPVTGASLRAPLSGEASRVVVGGRAVAVEAPSAPAAAVLVTGLSLAGLLAALLLVKGGAAWPFYVRLTPASLLRNENRRRIYEAVRARPGATVAELVRETALAEVVVRHHVRMLEAYRYLTVRGSGKLRACFALDGATDPEAMQAHVALKDGTRRRIAALLAASPAPLTQADLAGAAGVSRRLVSHHLARLESSGLVEAAGRTPREYRATPRLRGILGAAAARRAA